MEIFAYCGQSFEDATRRATGTEPLVCPPQLAATFEPQWLEGHDLLYFDFHGLPGDDCWFEELPGTLPIRIPALNAEQIAEADLGGAVVIALTCYLGDEDSPMLDALLDAGARYVIGGAGQNWANRSGVTGAALLAREMIRHLADVEPPEALTRAKRRVRLDLIANALRLNFGQVKAAKDTLGFRAFYRKDKIV